MSKWPSHPSPRPILASVQGENRIDIPIGIMWFPPRWQNCASHRG